MYNPGLIFIHFVVFYNASRYNFFVPQKPLDDFLLAYNTDPFWLARTSSVSRQRNVSRWMLEYATLSEAIRRPFAGIPGHRVFRVSEMYRDVYLNTQHSQKPPYDLLLSYSDLECFACEMYRNGSNKALIEKFHVERSDNQRPIACNSLSLIVLDSFSVLSP